MKKYIIFFILTFLLSGCTLHTSLIENEVIKIQDRSITLNKEDYSPLIHELNKLYFSKREQKIKVQNTLSITTKNALHIFSISHDNKLKYQINNHVYYSSNQKTIKKIKNLLEQYHEIYLKKNFFHIEQNNTYQESANDLVIKIDKIQQYFILTSEMKISNFKIHKVEWKNNNYQDIDLIYEANVIPKNKVIAMRMNPRKDYFSYRISFTNPYGLYVSIIPTYEMEKETGKLEYNIEYTMNH